MESGVFEKLDQSYFNDFLSDGPDFEFNNSVLLKDHFEVTTCSNDDINDINWLEDDDFIKSDFHEADFEKTYKEWERHITSLRKAQEPEAVVSVIEEIVTSPVELADVVNDDGCGGGSGETTDHLGPDNYEVVEIKVEDEDECIVEIEDHAGQGRVKNQQSNVKSKRTGAKKNKSKKTLQLDDKKLDHNYCTENRPTFKPLPEEYDAFAVTEEDRWALEKENTAEDNSVTDIVAPPTVPVTAVSCLVVRKDANNKDPAWDKNSKKDSGLESGEVSDASLNGSQQEAADAPGGENTDVKKDAPKKKKLNLDEYRTRRKFTKVISPKKHGSIAEAILTNEWARGSNQNTILPKKVDNDVASDDRLPKCELSEDRAKEKPYSEECERRSRRRRRSMSSSSSGSSKSHSRRTKRRSYRSRSRHRNRSRSTSSNSSSRSGSSRRSRRGNRSRSRSDYRYRSSRRYSVERHGEKQKQIEERRVVFVGQIEDGVTKAQLKERFKVFGPVVDISLHFRERGDNYGFVTFAHKSDAYQAVEHGNDNPLERRYDICFGGRRAFCRQRYADLDSMGPQQSYTPYLPPTVATTPMPRVHTSFDALLREAQEKLRKRKQMA